MQATSRPSSTRGLSSRGTLLLAATGTGLAAFLFFVLPRLSESRAATSPRPSAALPESEAPRDRPPAELVQPRSIELEEPAPPPASVAAAITTIEQPAVEVAEAKVEGPRMKYMKGSGQAREVDRRDPRISNRERRKERRENAALGIQPEPGAEKFRSAPSQDGKRLNRSKGRSGLSKGKPAGG